MKLLLVSDLHCDADAARRCVERSAGVDVVVGAGDFAVQGSGLQPIIDILATIERPVVLVPGNGETAEQLVEACAGWSAVRVLHGNGATIDGVEFYGLGGGVPVTPFDWSFDLTEAQASERLADCPSGAVLVSHSPPKGAVDVGSSGEHLGSVAVRETIERTAPRLVVCGHIHACAGQHEQVGATPVVNAGPAGLEWTLETSAGRDDSGDGR